MSLIFFFQDLLNIWLISIVRKKWEILKSTLASYLLFALIVRTENLPDLILGNGVDVTDRSRTFLNTMLSHCDGEEDLPEYIRRSSPFLSSEAFGKVGKEEN